MLWRTALSTVKLPSASYRHQLCGFRLGQQTTRSFTAFHPTPWTINSRFTESGRRSIRTLSTRPERSLRNEVASTRGNSLHDDLAKDIHPSFEERVAKPGIRNQVLFALFGSCLAFTYAATKTNHETEYWKQRLANASSIWSLQNITSVDLKRVQNAELIKSLREGYVYVARRAQEIPGSVGSWVSVAYVSIMQPYADASEGKRLCWKICLLNLAVWGAWKVSRFQVPMAIRFMHNPLSGLSFTLLTSVFSHKSFIHLAFNCLALESFGSAAYYYLLKEQGKFDPPLLESTTSWHFLAFFISAGLFSGLVSHVVAAKIQYPRLIAQLAKFNPIKKRTDTWAAALAAETSSASTTASAAAKAAGEVRTILPSLGASGAVYAAVTMTALAFPDSQVALFIPPSYPLPIQWAVGGLVTMDLIGIMRGWRVFDHWAHLGGAAFGALYYAYGPAFWNALRREVVIEQP